MINCGPRNGGRACAPGAVSKRNPVGVAFDAVDDQLMLLARAGTVVAGEMLDWEATTGGYLLQASFATGVRAAEGIKARLGLTAPAA